MPSSVSRHKARAYRVQSDSLRGVSHVLTPEIVVPVFNLAAAQFTGANSGIFVFIAPFPCMFLGMEGVWATAGTNTLRAKKILAAATSAPGAAADANNIDISAALALTGAANTVFSVAPVVTSGVHRLAQGDKVALASAAGTASLAGATIVLRFGAI